MVSGTNLSSDIKIVSPTGFEISEDSVAGYALTLTLSVSDNAVAETVIYVRMMKGLSVNDYTGNMVLASNGISAKKVMLSGTVVNKTAINDLRVSGLLVVSTHYFTLSGQKVNNIEQRNGMFIEKRLMSDGTVQISKVFKNQ